MIANIIFNDNTTIMTTLEGLLVVCYPGFVCGLNSVIFYLFDLIGLKGGKLTLCGHQTHGLLVSASVQLPTRPLEMRGRDTLPNFP